MAQPKKQAKTDTAPKREFNAIGQVGLKAQKLATDNAVAIGSRLSAAFLVAFAADLVALPDTVPTAIASHDGQVQLTSAQTAALTIGYNLINGMRTTVKGHNPTADVALAYGIGSRINRLLVKDVVAGLQKIQARMAAEPTEAASFDLVAADKTAITNALAAITAADQAQEAGRAAAPLTTAQRNATGRRVLAGVKKIAGAGMRTFPNDPTLYASFAKLVSKSTAAAS